MTGQSGLPGGLSDGLSADLVKTPVNSKSNRQTFLLLAAFSMAKMPGMLIIDV